MRKVNSKLIEQKMDGSIRSLSDINLRHCALGAMILALPHLTACSSDFFGDDRSLPEGCMSVGRSMLGTYGDADAKLSAVYDFTDWKGGKNDVFPGFRESKKLVFSTGGDQQAIQGFLASKDNEPSILMSSRRLFRSTFGPGNPHKLLKEACHRYSKGITIYHLSLSRS